MSICHSDWQDYIYPYDADLLNYEGSLKAREALERFPLMSEHVVEDGPDPGERRLYFTTGQHDLALPFMMNRFRSPSQCLRRLSYRR